MYADYEIREVPIGYGPARRKVEEFLGKRTLRLDKVDYYEAIYPCGGDEMLAVGGLLGDAIRCIAVKEDMEDEHLANRLVSHLMVIVQRRGYPTVKVFTKPSNKAVFESLAFETLAETDSVVFMENGQMPLRDYLLSLERLARPGKSGVIVMNCNPFTRGHRYLIEEASKQVDNLYVIPLKENNRNFNYEERREMIRLGTADLANVTVCEGSAYAISQATFPTYFLKQLDKASENQIELDLQIFARYLAPALGATVRFVGTEPFDPLTRRYNEMMTELLPKSGIEVVQIERKELEEKPISASRTRAFIENNKLHAAMQLVPPTTQPYIMAKFAVDALQQELDTTPKPGLVDKDNSIPTWTISSWSAVSSRCARISSGWLSSACPRTSSPRPTCSASASRPRPPCCVPPTGSTPTAAPCLPLASPSPPPCGSTPTRGRRCARSVCSR